MMTKPVAIGVLLFVAGIVVGRVSVLMTQPESTRSAAPSSAQRPPMMAAAPSVAAKGQVLRGTVAEVIQVPQYTYLRLESGEWAAVASAPNLTAGQGVGIELQTEMVDFSSPSLGRTFARIWFGALEGAEPGSRMPDPAPMPTMKAAPPSEVKAALQAVESGPALTLRVSDVYSEKAMLAGKRVKVKGTVDRISLVQGVHYLHLKDGSGTAASKNDDLLCLSSIIVPQGSAVTMEGVVALDKDIGMGPIPVVLDAAAPK